MSDEVSLPARIQSGASPEDLIRTIQGLQDYIEAREPSAFGGKLQKFIPYGAAVQSGLLALLAGGTASGASGDSFAPGLVTSNPSDASQPTPITGLAAAEGVGYYMVTIGAPTYTQGGGNGRTIIYSANYSGAGPLPTFADAAEAGTIPGRGVMLVVSAEPGVQVHFWAKAETRHPTLQASPTGGTNGVTATADLIDNQHIISLTAAKLTAGSVGVSEYIQSTGFTTGSAGWQIKGDGTAEFSGVIVRGTLYATAGTIGGITIESGAIRYGQTAYDTGTGYWLGNVAGVPKFSIGSSTKALLFDGTTTTLRGDVVATSNVQSNGITVATSAESVSLSAPYGSEGTLLTLSALNTTVDGTAQPVYIHVALTGEILGKGSGITTVTMYVRINGGSPQATFTFSAVAAALELYEKSWPVYVASPPTGDFTITVTHEIDQNTGGCYADTIAIAFALGTKR